MMERRLLWVPALLALVACGDGDGEKNVRGTQLVAGADLKVEDVSEDGALIAYTDGADTLFVVSTDGGAPIQVAEGVDDARFEGQFLVAFQGESADKRTAATLLTLAPGDEAAQIAGTNVSINSVRASFDGLHLFFAENQADPQFEDLFLDGVGLVTGVENSRGRFSPLNDVLVLSTTIGDQSLVQAVPLGGGAPVVLAAGASNRFQIAADGRVIIGADENGDVADLTLLEGANATVLAPQASDNGFRLLDDQDTLAFLSQNGGVSIINLDGSGAADLVADGALELVAASSTGVIYATAFDVDSEVGDIRFVALDGTGDIAVGTNAADEGLSSDFAFYLFRDQAAVDPVTQEAEVGTLTVLDIGAGTLTELGGAVKKASYLNAGRVAFLDQADVLQVADLASGEVAVFQDLVDRFDLVPDDFGAETASRVVFSVKDGDEAGVYIDDIE